MHHNAVRDRVPSTALQNPDTPEHPNDTSLHAERVPGEYQISADLARVIDAWDCLDPEQKAQVLAIVSGSHRRETG